MKQHSSWAPLSRYSGSFCSASRVVALITLIASVAPAWSADASAAEEQLKSNNCVKCHAVDRKKDGPAYRDVAAKLRGEPDAEQKIIYHVTSGEKVKFPDGHEEHHKKIKTADEQQLKNLAQWIMALQGGSKY